MNKFLIFFFLIITYTENILCTENNTDDTFTIQNTNLDVKELKNTHSKIENSNSPLPIIDLLEKEAKRLDNTLYTTLAYKEKAYFYSKQSRTDSTELYLNRISENLEILDKSGNLSDAEKEEVEDIRVFAMKTKYFIYIDESKYEIVLINVHKILEDPKTKHTPRLEAEAYTLLGTAYLYTKSLNEAIKCFRKAMNIDAQLLNKERLNNYDFYRPMEGLSIAYAGSSRYREALLLSDSLIKRINETNQYFKKTDSENTHNEFMYRFHKSRAECYAALWNIRTNNTRRARALLDSIEYFRRNHNNSSVTPTDFNIYEYTESNYWFAVGDLKKAKEYALSMTSITLENNVFAYMLTHLQLVKILNAEGRCSEAYTLMAKLYRQNDSISVTNFSNHLAEMHTRYKVDKAEMAALKSEKELIKAKNFLFIAFFIIVISLSIAFLTWLNRKKIVKKNIQLYSQYIEIKNRNKEIAALQRGLLKQQDEEVSNQIDSNNLLIQKLNEYLLETKCFLNPELTREELAVHIGTNRQYLIEAIKDKTGKTFNEYIYSFRLEYAHEQIINDRKKPISEILFEAGFLTRTTFYKSFKETYGLTPNELRRILN